MHSYPTKISLPPDRVHHKNQPRYMGKSDPKFLGDVGFLLFFRVVSGDEKANPA